MEKTNDGFYIADEDLKLRGPGEVFGIKQSGFFQYKIADIVKDGKIIHEARELAFKLVSLDPALSNKFNKGIREVFTKKYSNHLENLNFI
jgi:ATP-dependent DNA helicase RecG